MTKPPAGTLSKAPEVTVWFWVIKVLATTLGETGGDAVTMSMDMGYAIGSIIFIGIFAALIAAQISAKAFHPLLYWVTIVATTTLGTTMADFADRSLGIGYSGGSAILFVGLIASLAAWRWSEGSISVNTRCYAPGRDVLLGRDPVLADARNGSGRLDGRHERAWLRGRAVVFAAGLVAVVAAYFTRKYRLLCCFGRRSFSRDRLARRWGTCWTNRTIRVGSKSAASWPQEFSQRSLSLSSSSSPNGLGFIRALAREYVR